jgi:membrane protease YdiL (CAAX protease family)
MEAAARTTTGSLFAFFTITFAITWTCFFAAASPTGIRMPILMLGVFAPALVALSLTARAEGVAGVVALLQRLFAWRVSARWYVFAVGYMAAIKLSVAVVHRVAFGAWPRFGDEAWYVIVAATIASLVVGGQSGEEIGWRGYALPRLAERFGMVRASLILGVVWAVWHLPLFFIAGANTTGQSFPVYLLQVTAISVTMAWLYVNTNGSLLLAMLMHSAINQSKDIVPSAVPGANDPFALSTSPVAWLTVMLLWTCAAWFLVRLRASGTRQIGEAGAPACVPAGG